jgi:hypothetical protein
MCPSAAWSSRCRAVSACRPSGPRWRLALGTQPQREDADHGGEARRAHNGRVKPGRHWRSTAPDRSLPSQGAAIAIQRSHESAVVLGGDHLEQLPAPRHQDVQLLQGFIGPLAHLGTHTLGNESEPCSVDSIGLCELPRRTGEIADLARVHHRHG